MSKKVITGTLNFKPMMLASKVIVALIAFGILSAASVSFAVALPWALVVSALITITFNE